MKTNAYWQQQVPGIPDQEFLRGAIPMTKEEIRVLTLAKGKILPQAIVYDIGAGTGSLSIEAALLAPTGQVWALEKNPDAIELIHKNKNKFKTNNLNILNKEAPEGLKDLPPANVILIGGSGGHLKSILEICSQQLQPEGRIILNAITYETMEQALHFARDHDFEYEIIGVSVSRLEKLAAMHMWKGLNPIQIITLRSSDQ